MQALFFLLLLYTKATFAQTNTWMQKPNFPSTARQDAASFFINGNMYLLTGYSGVNSNNATDDLWEYEPIGQTWSQKTSLLNNEVRYGSFGFAIGNKGYLVCGADFNNNFLSTLFEYDLSMDQWTQKASLPNVGRVAVFGFVLNGKAYIGGGQDDNGAPLSDFWEYDPQLDVWTQKNNLPFGGRFEAASGAIGSYGYMSCGYNGSVTLNDLWQYDPTNDSWTQKTSLPALSRRSPMSFALGGKLYVGGGRNGTGNFLSDFSAYDTLTDTWDTSVCDFPRNCWRAVGVSNGIRGYVGTGKISNNLVVYDDWWEYTPDTAITTAVAGPISANTVHVFPNPAIGGTHVSVSWSGEYTAEIRTVTGAKVRDIAGSGDLCIERGGLAPGVYVLTIMSPYGTKPESIKIVFTD